MLNVGYATLDGNWNWKNVSSPFTRIYLATEGTAWLHFAKESVQVKPGFLYMVPAYTMHSYECDGAFSHYYLHVYEGYKKETDVFDLYRFPIEVKAEEPDIWMFRIMCRIFPEAQLTEHDPKLYDNAIRFTDYIKRYNELELGAKMQLRGSSLILFSRFMKYALPKVWTNDVRLLKVLKYIQNNIYKNIEVDVLADLACVTNRYLIRLFKRDLGVTPLQYINRKKVEKAQLMLLTQTMMVKEIAYSLGFSDHSYFNRLFKKIVGQTPQGYRDNMK